MNQDEKYTCFRLKQNTFKELKRLKLATEGDLGREITNDEFTRLLITRATSAQTP